MSMASCSYQMAWVPDGATYTATLLGSQGDLFQTYGNTASNPTDVIPNWDTATTKPFVKVVLMVSDPDLTQADLPSKVSDTDTQWYVDGMLVKFNDSTGLSMKSSVAGELNWDAGYFKKLKASEGNASYPYGGLMIMKNLVTPSGGQNIPVRCVVALNPDDNKVVNAQGETTIRMVKSAGESNFASIYCDETNANGLPQSFVLEEDSTQNKDRVTCKVKAWRGGNEVTSFSCKWYLMRGGKWGKYDPATKTFTQDTPQGTGNTLLVTRDMIDTFGDVKVECYESGATEAFASDIQTVADVSDPYILNPNPDPADGKFYQSGSVQQVVFKPTVTDRQGSPASGVKGFYFVVMDTAGVTLNSDNTTLHSAASIATSGYSVPFLMAKGSGTLVVNITAEGD